MMTTRPSDCAELGEKSGASRQACAYLERANLIDADLSGANLSPTVV
jgi:hypothetical protein